MMADYDFEHDAWSGFDDYVDDVADDSVHSHAALMMRVSATLIVAGLAVLSFAYFWLAR